MKNNEMDVNKLNNKDMVTAGPKIVCPPPAMPLVRQRSCRGISGYTILWADYICGIMPGIVYLYGHIVRLQICYKQYLNPVGTPCMASAPRQYDHCGRHTWRPCGGNRIAVIFP